MFSMTNTTTELTAETITDDQIRALRREAGEAGDVAMAELCDSALRGNADHRAHCAHVINTARAMGE